MENTKIIQLLKTFTPSEFTDFGKFLNSPFHNESPKMIRLYNYLKKSHPYFSDDRITKEIVFQKMYGDVKYDNKKFRERLSDMLSLAEDFLAIVNVKKYPVKYKMHTLKEFSDRNLAVHYDKKYREISNLLNKVKFKNEHSFYDDYLLHSSLIEFYQNSKLLGKRKAFFEEITDHIELFLRYFTAQMLQNYAVINNIKTVVQFNYEHKFYGELMKYIDENNLERFPLIKALKLIIKINEDRNDSASYFCLKELYLKYHESMGEYDKIMISTELQIHARVMLRKGSPDFKSEPFEIIKLQVEHKTYPVEKGWMKRESFMVVVDTAVGNGSIDWAREFVKEHTRDVDPELRENIKLWASGTLLFYDKKYGPALKEFSKIKIGDYVYYFWVKVPVSIIYYEMKEYDNVLMEIDSIRHYVEINKFIPEQSKVWYGTFFNFLYKLTLLTLKYDAHKAAKLAEDIKSSLKSSTANNSWLLEKVNQLKKHR